MLALICLGLAVALWSHSRSGRVAVALCGGSDCRVDAGVARDLPQQLRAAFGDAVPGRPSALVYQDLFRGSYPSTSIVPRLRGPVPVVVMIHGGSCRAATIGISFQCVSCTEA